MTTPLGSTLHRIVSAVLASSTCLVAGACQSTPPLELEGEEEFTCGPTPASLLANLRPAAPFDYAELREYEIVNAAERAQTGSTTPVSLAPPATIDAFGQPCRTATDRATCLANVARVDALPRGWLSPSDPPAGVPSPEKSRVLVLITTQADDVRVARTADEVRAALGPIDTLEEALLVLQASRATNPLTCYRSLESSYQVIDEGIACDGARYRERVGIDRSGTVTLLEEKHEDANGSVCGRRPAGLVVARRPAETLAAFLSEVAHLEAASVLAFARLEGELTRLGAPVALRQRAAEARRDEIRHARATGRAALRHGGARVRVEAPDPGERTAYAIAEENAVEGCVREAFGALVAAFQGHTARDPALARLFTAIAEDEIRHAELAHDVAGWLEPQLSPAERTQLGEARQRAIAELRRAAAVAPPAALTELAGLPTASDALALVDHLDHALLRLAA